MNHLDDLTSPGSSANKEIPRMRNEDHIHHSWLLCGLPTFISQTCSNFVSARLQVKLANYIFNCPDVAGNRRFHRPGGNGPENPGEVR